MQVDHTKEGRSYALHDPCQLSSSCSNLDVPIELHTDTGPNDRPSQSFLWFGWVCISQSCIEHCTEGTCCNSRDHCGAMQTFARRRANANHGMILGQHLCCSIGERPSHLPYALLSRPFSKFLQGLLLS